MSEPETPAEQVGGQNQPISEADTDDQYQDPEMGELEVRDTTGFSESMLAPPTPRDIQYSTEPIQRYDQARIESVVREALENCLSPMLTEISSRNKPNANPGYLQDTNHHFSRFGDNRYEDGNRWDKTPQRRGYQRGEDDFYSREVPRFYTNEDTYWNGHARQNDRTGRTSIRNQNWEYQTSPSRGPSGQRRGYMGPNFSPRYANMGYPNSPRLNDQHKTYQDYSMSSYREDCSVKVRPFISKESDWFTYKTHFEAIASQACWSEKTKCLKLMGALQGNLTGITAGMQYPFRYDQLVARLDAVHGISNDKEDALMKLGSCRKFPDESVPMYGERVRQLVERAFPNYGPNDKDEQGLRVFLNGLPTKHDMRLNMKLKGFRSLREAVSYGSRLDHIITSEKGFDKRTVNFQSVVHNDREVNEGCEENSGDLSDIISKVCKQVISETSSEFGAENPKEGKTKFVKKTPENSPCHICSQLGHWANECPSRSDKSGQRPKSIKPGQSQNEQKGLN